MAASIEFKRGNTLIVSAVHEGTKQDGTPWQQIHVKDETGKIEAGAFLTTPIANLREGDAIVIDDLSVINKRAMNRYSYNKDWSPKDTPVKFINESTPQITAHLAAGGGFGGGGFTGGWFQATELTPEESEAELPF